MNPEYWDFSYDTMGKYDNTANISKVLEVTGYEKLAFVAYSMGTTQTFYGMAKDTKDFYKNKVSVFVALAPCTKLTHSSFSFMSMGSTFYDRIDSVLIDSGVKAFYGPNWTADKLALCNKDNFLCLGVKTQCIGNGQTVSTRMIIHNLQSMVKD